VSQTQDLCADCTKYPAPAALNWLCHPLGQQYFLNASWTQLDPNSTFTSCINECKHVAFYSDICKIC